MKFWRSKYVRWRNRKYFDKFGVKIRFFTFTPTLSLSPAYTLSPPFLSPRFSLSLSSILSVPATGRAGTGSVRLVSKPRSQPTPFPRRKPRIPTSVPTGSNRILHGVAPSSPPSNSGELGEVSSPFYVL
ncbi:unnamed protein product [Prunus armeniaca]